LSGLIDVEWIFYEANLPRRHSTLWEARYLNGVAHLSKRLDDSVQHTEFTVASLAQLANGVLTSDHAPLRRATEGVTNWKRNYARDCVGMHQEIVAGRQWLDNPYLVRRYTNNRAT
jgi:hypothetical protein